MNDYNNKHFTGSCNVSKAQNEINKHSKKTQYFKLYKFLIYKIKIYYYLPWLRYVSC